MSSEYELFLAASLGIPAALSTQLDKCLIHYLMNKGKVMSIFSSLIFQLFKNILNLNTSGSFIMN